MEVDGLTAGRLDSRRATGQRRLFLYCAEQGLLVRYGDMLMIRFQRIGRTNDPAFRIVLVEKERAAKTGRVGEVLGSYNPKTKALNLKEEQIKNWIGKGAQLTPSIHNLLIAKGVISGKKINVLPKKTVAKAEEPAPAAEVAPAAPSETPAA